MNSGSDKNSFSDAEIQKLLKKSLDQSTESIDAVTSSRLSAARHRALEHAQTSSPWGWLSPWKGGLAALSVCVLALSVLLNDNDQAQSANTVATEQSGMFADLEILASKDDVEFYESLDFLLWLENAPENSG